MKPDPKKEFRSKMIALVDAFIQETDKPNAGYWTPGMNLDFVLFDFFDYFRNSLPEAPRICGEGQ